MLAVSNLTNTQEGDEPLRAYPKGPGAPAGLSSSARLHRLYSRSHILGSHTILPV